MDDCSSVTATPVYLPIDVNVTGKRRRALDDVSFPIKNEEVGPCQASWWRSTARRGSRNDMLGGSMTYPIIGINQAEVAQGRGGGDDLLDYRLVYQLCGPSDHAIRFS
jgi:hypothetical protein